MRPISTCTTPTLTPGYASWKPNKPVEKHALSTSPMGPSNPNYNISHLEQDLLPLRLSLQPGLSKDSNKTKSVFGYSQITIGVVNSIHISFY